MSFLVFFDVLDFLGGNLILGQEMRAGESFLVCGIIRQGKYFFCLEKVIQKLNLQIKCDIMGYVNLVSLENLVVLV